MEAEKVYKVGPDPESAMRGTLSWDFYAHAEEYKNKINDGLGTDLKVYKIVMEVTEADRASEDYWEY